MERKKTPRKKTVSKPEEKQVAKYEPTDKERSLRLGLRAAIAEAKPVPRVKVDGDSAYNYAVISQSLAAGKNSPKDCALAILKTMGPHGVTQGYIPDLKGQPLPRGKVIYGMARDEMRKVAGNPGTSWSIQDGKVNMIPLTAYKPGDIPVITSATGMVGLPEQTQNGIKVKVLLNPNIKIGQAIQIDNKSIQKMRFSLSNDAQSKNGYDALANKLNDDGFYYVMCADHSGDTRGNAWYTDLTCLAIDATAVPLATLGKVKTPGNEYIDTIGTTTIGSVKRFP